MKDNYPNKRTPWWMTVIILIVMVPVIWYLLTVGGTPADETAKILMWFYPAYVVVSGLCAWITYPQRPEVSWILVVLMILSHIGISMLGNLPAM